VPFYDAFGLVSIHSDLDGLETGRKRGLHQLSKKTRFHPAQDTYCRNIKLHTFTPLKFEFEIFSRSLKVTISNIFPTIVAGGLSTISTIPLIHRLLSLPEIDASHPGKEVVLIEIAGQGGGREVVRM
jgi:hypothetical protein